MINRVVKCMGTLLFLMMLCFVSHIKAEAAVLVPASNDKSGKTDYKQISEALKNDRDIILEEGKTYYLKGTLWVESNQSITATGATII